MAEWLHVGANHRKEMVPEQVHELAARGWALRNNVTACDRWCVALAEGLGCPPATLDKRLSRTAGSACEIITPPEEGV